jgi:hypothetical protein
MKHRDPLDSPGCMNYVPRLGFQLHKLIRAMVGSCPSIGPLALDLILPLECFTFFLFLPNGHQQYKEVIANGTNFGMKWTPMFSPRNLT